MKKGFALDDERLKNLGGGNYFDELLSRIRDIRSSEKVFWRKVLEIYALRFELRGCVIGNQPFPLHAPPGPASGHLFPGFLPEWHKSASCLHSSVYLRGFLFCFVPVILAAPLLMGFILYDLKKSVQFIAAYPKGWISFQGSRR